MYKSGTGQGDRDIGTRVWGLGTWGRETGDLRTSAMGPGDVWDGDGDAGTSKTWMQRMSENLLLRLHTLPLFYLRTQILRTYAFFWKNYATVEINPNPNHDSQGGLLLLFKQ